MTLMSIAPSPRPETPGFAERPLVAIWEATRACDLVCQHCRAAAQPRRSRFELTTAEARELIDQIRDLAPRVFVITGGDPLKRPDLFELIEYATAHGVTTSVAPSVTSLLDAKALIQLKRSGAARIALSVDGATPAVHDAFRGVAGSFESTLRLASLTHAIDLPLQINTTLHRGNLSSLRGMAALVESLGAVVWSIFLIVPTGRGRMEQMPSAAEVEEAFETLFALARSSPFTLKTTEAMHYRRFVMQRGERPPSAGVNDGKGYVFISHTGEVNPSGFLPMTAGNVRRGTLSAIYRHSPLFIALRMPSFLKGKCGRCEFRDICGGSRARAYAVTGDPFAEEPLCAYVPDT